MPRQPRLHLADYPFHIVQRGHNKGAVFLSDPDRLKYLDELRTVAQVHRVSVHAYVLMTNHVHLLATSTLGEGLSDLMRFVNQRYVQYFNRKYGRTGSLWEGRPYSCLVEAESYLLTCHRYVEANPVRAGMVTAPGDYRWSSYRANAHGEPDPVIKRHEVIEAMGATSAERGDTYRTLFETPLTPDTLAELRSATLGGFAVGTDAFKSGAEKSLQRRLTRIGPGRRKQG